MYTRPILYRTIYAYKHIPTCRLKAGIVKPEEMSIARKLRGKHVCATTLNKGTIVETVFSVVPPRGYITRILDS
jgi:hypothetical protein